MEKKLQKMVRKIIYLILALLFISSCGETERRPLRPKREIAYINGKKVIGTGRRIYAIIPKNPKETDTIFVRGIWFNLIKGKGYNSGTVIEVDHNSGSSCFNMDTYSSIILWE